jgi:chromosome segregation ATPase
MARGITQDQVNAAADAILATGENPTVEKVRTALGTGSPNTVTRMLEVWRTALGQRLQQAQALPELPSAVGQAMREVWRLATESAHATALTRLSDERAALEDDRRHLADERTRWTAALDDAAAVVTQAQTKQQLAEHACATLDGQLQDSHALRADIVQQRDRLQGRCDELMAELARLQAEYSRREAGVAEERIRRDAHVQAVEDRAHREVDHARQESRALQQQVSALQQEHDRTLATEIQQREHLQQMLRELEQRAALHEGRAAALEVALAVKKAQSARGAKAPAAKPRSTRAQSAEAAGRTRKSSSLSNRSPARGRKTSRPRNGGT